MREIKFRVWDTYENKMIYDPGFERIGEYHQPCDHPVMQFTGLIDSTGKDIYEGDIVGPGNYEIKFGPYDNGEKYEDAQVGIGFYVRSYGHIFSLLPEDEYVIEGNIYENPNLLEFLHFS